MLKKIKILLVTLFVGVLFAQGLVQAQGTILPDAGKENCDELLKAYASGGYTDEIAPKRDVLLGCAIKTGRISLSMVPYFIQYISNYLLGMVGLVSLLFTVLGGFLYIAGGLNEQKDKGKKYITNALTGMGIAFLAWTIVNVIMAALTG